MRKYVGSSIPHKLNYRQILGSVRLRAGEKPFRFYDKCPETLQIPLRKIMKREELMRGHIAVGFTEDGTYFLTYICNIKFQPAESSACAYRYTLFWWRFNLWRPLRKVHEVELFPNENIPNEIHLMICQTLRSNYIVIHGSTFGIDCQSRRVCYVSVVPRLESNVDYSLHWRYELLPPYPPFVTSVSLKLPNVILLNSGDMMFAILTPEQLFGEPRNNQTQQNEDCECYCQHRKKFPTNTHSNEIDARPSNTSACEHDRNNTVNFNNTDDFLHDSNSCEISTDIRVNGPEINGSTGSNVAGISSNVSDNNLSAYTATSSRESDVDVDDDGSDERCVDYVSYVRQGFAFPNDGDTQDTLPDSPFDCTATVIPCYLSSLCGDVMLKNVFEHRCFRSLDKGCFSSCQYFISQVQFDAETFINEELQKNESISRRFVSLRDYDMQLVEVCQHNNEVIILINALVVLRTSTGKKSTPKTALCALEEHQTSKLVQYTAGYLLTWDVYTGVVGVLQSFPLVERSGNICKNRHFCPSLSQTVQLRKKWFIPSCKQAAVQTISNHTVFTGKSLQFLVHPEFPVAVVL